MDSADRISAITRSNAVVDSTDRLKNPMVRHTDSLNTIVSNIRHSALSAGDSLPQFLNRSSDIVTEIVTHLTSKADTLPGKVDPAKSVNERIGKVQSSIDNPLKGAHRKSTEWLKRVQMSLQHKFLQANDGELKTFW